MEGAETPVDRCQGQTSTSVRSMSIHHAIPPRLLSTTVPSHCHLEIPDVVSPAELWTGTRQGRARREQRIRQEYHCPDYIHPPYMPCSFVYMGILDTHRMTVR